MPSKHFIFSKGVRVFVEGGGPPVPWHNGETKPGSRLGGPWRFDSWSSVAGPPCGWLIAAPREKVEGTTGLIGAMLRLQDTTTGNGSLNLVILGLGSGACRLGCGSLCTKNPWATVMWSLHKCKMAFAMTDISNTAPKTPSIHPHHHALSPFTYRPSYSSGVTRRADRPGWHHPGGDTRIKLFFCDWI